MEIEQHKNWKFFEVMFTWVQIHRTERSDASTQSSVSTNMPSHKQRTIVVENLMNVHESNILSKKNYHSLVNWKYKLENQTH